MSDLSRFLLVSNGNVTGIIDRLVSEGLVLRARRNGDRRTSMVRLTEAGVAQFGAMAAAHEDWIDELLGNVSDDETRRLAAMLTIVPQQLGGTRVTGFANGRTASRSISSGRSKARCARIRSTGPERKNPLTFESYAELRDTFSRPGLCRRRRGGGVRCRTAAISAPAAMCTTSSARWSGWT